jgi:serine/threonine protein kinase
MALTLSDLLQLLRSAAAPVDVFGVLPGEPQAALKRRYRELVAIAHPDRNPANADAATQACIGLQEWHAAAQRQIAQGVYGLAPRIRAATKLHQYLGYAPPLQGDLCELFPAEAANKPVLLKVARLARNNDLLQAEAQALRTIGRALDGQPARAHFPTLSEHFLLCVTDGAQRQANVLRAEAGYVSLAEVLRAYPSGLAAADAAWMFNRILTGLGIAHSLGIVHGAITPAHVLVRPADHNGMLIDWCYSAPVGTPLKAISPPYAADYPPEVHGRQPATAATDLYMAARCMARLLGGQLPVLELPASVPRPIRTLLSACLLPSAQRRADDAWQVFEDFHEILGRLYGPPRFRPFHMPRAPSARGVGDGRYGVENADAK